MRPFSCSFVAILIGFISFAHFSRASAPPHSLGVATHGILQGVTSAGAELDQSFAFEVGYWADGFNPASGNRAQWAANWTPVVRADWDPATEGACSAVPLAGVEATPGTPLYLWAYNHQSGSNGQWLLLRSDEWTMPGPGELGYTLISPARPGVAPQASTGKLAVVNATQRRFEFSRVDLLEGATITAGTDNITATVREAYQQAAPGLLGNDRLGAGGNEGLYISSYDRFSALGADITVNAAGAFTYDPTQSSTIASLPLGETHTDTFKYQVSNGQTSRWGLAVVTLAPPGDLPVAGTDYFSTHEDGRFTSLSGALLWNDQARGGGALAVVDYAITSAQGARVEVGSDGTLVYDPTSAPSLQSLREGETAEDSFTYTLSNGSIQVSGRVQVSVAGRNGSPEFISLPVRAASEGTPYEYIVRVKDEDAGEAITLSGGNLASWLTLQKLSGNSWLLTGDPGNAPATGQTVALTATDSAGASTRQEFVIAVEHGNQAPVQALPQVSSVRSGGSFAFRDAYGSAIQIRDPESSGGQLRVTVEVDQGTLSLGDTSGLTFSEGSASGSQRLTFRGTESAINAALETLDFQAPAGFTGEVALTVTTDDLGSGLNHGSSLTTGSVKLTVRADPSAPQVVWQPQNASAAIGQDFALQVFADGDQPMEYQWYVGRSGDTSNPVPGADGRWFNGVSNAEGRVMLWVRVTNPRGSVDSSTAVVDVGADSPDLWAGFVNLGGEWRWSDWLGAVNATYDPWFYHQSFGWFYTQSRSPEEIWLYDRDLGWLFTRWDIFPALFHWQEGSWLYYLPESSQPRYFYDYGSALWLEQ